MSAAGPGAGASPGAIVLSRLLLSRSTVDRSAQYRSDEPWLARAWADPDTRVLMVERGRALVAFGADGAELILLPAQDAPDGVRFLLGVDAGGVAYFGVVGPLPEGAEVIGVEVRPATLREAGPLLTDRDAGLLTHAVALANWHESAQHCPRCGAVSEPVSSGHARRCPVDHSDQFPRVDPAMIVLVTDPDDRCLLARNAQWPAHRVSILAGFVEAGESAEQAVAREVQEEVGLAVTEITYLGSQPWPMPQSLMLGFRAVAASSLEISVDHDEIAEARWYSREDLAAAMADGSILIPPSVSIAHQIIQAWYGRELPSTDWPANGDR